MKSIIEGHLLKFYDYTPNELDKLKSLLTWENKSYNKTSDDSMDDSTDDSTESTDEETLLFTDDEYKSCYTFWGIYDILEKELDINLENRPEFAYEKIDIQDDILDNIKLRPYQLAAAKKSLLLKHGIVDIPTAGGKTEIILAIVKYLLNKKIIERGLIVVPSVALSKQFKSRAGIRGFDDNIFGALNGEDKELDTTIVVAVINSLNHGIKANNEKVLNLINNAELVIFDEAHHWRASTWSKIALSVFNAKYLIGFSGSPFHTDDILKDSGDTLVYAIAGSPIFKITLRYLIDKGYVANPIIYFLPIKGRVPTYNISWYRLYKNEIVENKQRNMHIIKYAKTFTFLNFPVLILVQRHEHVHKLMSMFERNDKVIGMFGGNECLIRTEIGEIVTSNIQYDDFINNFNKGKWNIIIATQVFDEGVDIPSIGAFINAGGGRSRIKLLQRLGRCIRKKDIGFNQVYILDFLDRQHVYLFAQSRRRINLYNELDLTLLEDKYQFINYAFNHKEKFDELNESI